MSLMVLALLLAEDTTPPTFVACPGLAEVAEVLSRMSPEARLPQDARVQTEAEALFVSWTAQGQLHKRRLTAAPTCAERAQQAAVVIGASLFFLDGPELTLPKMPAPTAVAAAGTPTTSLDLRASVPVVQRKTARISAGMFAGGDSRGATWGVQGAFDWQHLWRGAGLRLGAAFTAPRIHNVDQGSARWSRASFSLGPVWSRYPRAHWNVGADLGPVLSLVSTSGSGFDEDRSDRIAMLGFGGGIRAGRSWQHVELWSEIRAQAWASQPTVVAQRLPSGSERTFDLSFLDAVLVVGMATPF